MKSKDLSNEGIKKVNPLPFDNMHGLFKTSKVGVREINMVKILGAGTTSDGQDYVMVDKSDFEELQVAKLLVDFAKQQGKEKEVLAKLTRSISPKASRKRKGTPTRVPKELTESFDKSLERALAKLEHTKGITDEDENSFYKLRDWTKVRI